MLKNLLFQDLLFKNLLLKEKKMAISKNDERQKALDAALSQIEKQFGKGAVMKLGDPAAQMNVETIPTGSLSLDHRDLRSRILR